jgi:flagellar basal body-associated protein FliL
MENNNNRNIWIILGIVVVLLCCCVLAVGAIIAAAGTGLFAAVPVVRQGSIGRVSERTEQVYSVGQAPMLEVDNFAGNVVVSSGESGRIRVLVTKQATSSNNLERIDVRIDQQDDGLRIETSRPGNLMSNASVNIEVFVPDDAQLDLSTGAGNVDVEDVLGQIAAHTGAGNVQVGGAAAAVALDTGAGEVDYEGQPRGTCTFRTGAGNVTLRLPADLGASLVLDTGIGNISLGGFDVQGNTRGTHVEGTIGSGEQATIQANTGVGNVTLIRR